MLKRCHKSQYFTRYKTSLFTGDSLTPSNNHRSFSTRDRDNDAWSGYSCVADWDDGAWWHGHCLNHAHYPYSSLNSNYHYSYIYWDTLPGYHYNITFTEMKIRPL